MKKYVVLMIVFAFAISFSFASTNYSNEEIEVKIFQISFEQDVNRNFDDLLLKKTEGFLKYQWEPEGLYVVMEKEITESEMSQTLSQLNFTGFYKISKVQNRFLPVNTLTK